MHEQNKINEAKYFLAQMTTLVNSREEFTYNLSAFLAAARSALQYALEEAKIKTGGQKWYERQVTDRQIVKFFKGKRDINIHSKPILPSAKIGVAVKGTVHLSVIFEATIKRKDGSTEEVKSTESNPASTPSKENETTVTYEHYFSDWKGNEDVLNLCDAYINEVETIVSDGKSKGLLS